MGRREARVRTYKKAHGDWWGEFYQKYYDKHCGMGGNVVIMESKYIPKDYEGYDETKKTKHCIMIHNPRIVFYFDDRQEMIQQFHHINEQYEYGIKRQKKNLPFKNVSTLFEEQVK